MQVRAETLQPGWYLRHLGPIESISSFLEQHPSILSIWSWDAQSQQWRMALAPEHSLRNLIEFPELNSLQPSQGVWIQLSDPWQATSPPTPAALNLPMIAIQGGTFLMGDTTGDISWAQPAHQVQLDAFQISASEITVAQYRHCVEAGICLTPGDWNYCAYGRENRENHPVNCVSQTDALQYAQWLNWDQPGPFRLCTEAEWEYAAKAGDTLIYGCGNQETCLEQVAWFIDNNSPYGTKAVKAKQPNAWGLYDLQGNVWEWVWDGYEDYPPEPQVNPLATEPNRFVVRRGGSFIDSTLEMRPAMRGNSTPDTRFFHIGIRLCADQ